MSIVTQILGCPPISFATDIKARKASVSHNKGLINGFEAFFTYFFCLFHARKGFRDFSKLKECLVFSLPWPWLFERNCTRSVIWKLSATEGDL